MGNPDDGSMFAYHMLASQWALDDLRRKRLKVSLLDDLNDPFELLGAELPTKRHRIRFARLETAGRYGVLCFSGDYTNPVQWSHYAGRHRGMCLMFRIRNFVPMKYTATRLVADIEEADDVDKLRALVPELLRTKYQDWAHENEVRKIVDLATAQQDGGHHFYPFGANLTLVKVMIGARCDTPISEVRAAAGRGVLVTRARLAFRTFRVIQAQQTPTPTRTSMSAALMMRLGLAPGSRRTGPVRR